MINFKYSEVIIVSNYKQKEIQIMLGINTYNQKRLVLIRQTINHNVMQGIAMATVETVGSKFQRGVKMIFIFQIWQYTCKHKGLYTK